jgi:hypothetical protein
LNNGVAEILKDIKKLFENNKRARIIQIKAEENIINKISQLFNVSESK